MIHCIEIKENDLKWKVFILRFETRNYEEAYFDNSAQIVDFLAQYISEINDETYLKAPMDVCEQIIEGLRDGWE